MLKVIGISMDLILPQAINSGFSEIPPGETCETRKVFHASPGEFFSK